MSLVPLRDVFLKDANYARQIQLLLERLEFLVAPRSPKPSLALAGSLAAIIGEPPALLQSEPNKTSLFKLIQTQLDSLEKDSQQLGFESVQKRIKRVRNHLSSLNAAILENVGDAKLKQEIGVLREAYDDDLDDRIVFIPQDSKVKEWLRDDHPFDKINQAFPSLRSDLSWATYSFITDNGTACIFYLMRAIELVMRILASHLGIKSISKKTLIPVEYAEWGNVCDVLKKKIESLQGRSRGRKKAADLRFYSDAASQIEWFNEIWRKNVAHSRVLYKEPDADSAMRRAKDLLNNLATRLVERS